MQSYSPSRILLAVDFSDVTDSLVDTVAGVARDPAGAVWVVHVAAPDPQFIGYEIGPQSVRDIRARELKDEHARLDEIKRALEAKNLHARAFLLQGETVGTLLEQAERMRADLVILGSHGHGMLFKSLVGSVSEGVLRGATCPVLLVPSPRT